MHSRTVWSLLVLALLAYAAPAAHGFAPAAAQRLLLPLVVMPASVMPTHTGEATFYDATGDGNCSFGPSPNDLMVGAMNQAEYANASLCGAYVEITGPRKAIVVRIVDRCPPCALGAIDLSREAFAQIADPVAGRVPMTWRIVSPPLSGPISYRFKEGSNPYWTAVQIRNHRNPIASVEYRSAGGQFRPVPREAYNYFVDTQGMGPGPYTFRVTDIYGHTLLDSAIALQVGGEVAGAAQFPPGP